MCVGVGVGVGIGVGVGVDRASCISGVYGLWGLIWALLLAGVASFHSDALAASVPVYSKT